jgi:hypothetical protein
MQLEIAQLQSKIKGLESKLSPYNSAALTKKEDDMSSQNPSFGKKEDLFKSGGLLTGDKSDK